MNSRGLRRIAGNVGHLVSWSAWTRVKGCWAFSGKMGATHVRKPTVSSCWRACDNWNGVAPLVFVKEQRCSAEIVGGSGCACGRDSKCRYVNRCAAVRAYLAHTKWPPGEVRAARALIEEAVAHVIETGHISTLVNVYFYKTHFEIVRGDGGAARRDAETVIKLSQENAMMFYTAIGAVQSVWASAWLDGRETGVMEPRKALAASTTKETILGAVLRRFTC